MSQNVSLDGSNLETLESQIDRLNLRIHEFVICNSLNASDSELVSPARESFKRTFEDLDKYLTTEESEANKAEYFKSNLNQMKMILEDFRSHEMREAEDLDLKSEMRSSFGLDFRKSDMSIKEISINELYLLFKQVKNVIKDVEEGDSSEKSIKFAGVSFLFSVAGICLPEKQKIFPIFLKNPESPSNPLKSNPNFSQGLEDKHLKGFISNLEHSMKQSFESIKVSETLKPRQPTNNASPRPSSVLLSRQYLKLKKQHKTCESLSSELKFQNLEAQISNNLLNQKYKSLLHKEGELHFRSQELNKLHQQNLELKEQLDSQAKQLKEEQKKLERHQHKLKNMKNLLKGQIDEIVKPLGSKLPARPISASRMTENSPTLRRIRNHSKNNDLDLEIEDTQSEISKLGLSLDSSSEDSVKLSKLRTKLSNLRSQKAIEINSATSESISSVFHTTPVRIRLSREASPLGSRHLEPSKPPTYKKVNINDRLKEEKGENLAKVMKKDLKTREKEVIKSLEKLPPADANSNQVQKELKELKSIQSEYELKIKELQEKIDLSDHSLSMTEEETNTLNSRIKKIKDLYGILEELTD